ncbi:MAG: group 1 truncated hemoglobin [Myxococcota bacterium]
MSTLGIIIESFVERCFSDPMIGFFFRKASIARVKHFELQHATEHLGGPMTYEGRPLRIAHQSHSIMGGQFMRRLKILQEVLQEHGVPQEIQDRWLAYHETLRSEVTKDLRSQCALSVEGSHEYDSEEVGSESRSQSEVVNRCDKA